jgi:hypothetical protein
MEMTEAMSIKILDGVRTQMVDRNKRLNDLIARYTNQFKDKSGYIPDENKGITF